LEKSVDFDFEGSISIGHSRWSTHGEPNHQNSHPHWDCAKKIFSLQKIDRFAFDIEVLWLAKKLNFKIKEVGLKWQEIPDSKVKIFKDGSEMFFSVLGLYKRHLLG